MICEDIHGKSSGMFIAIALSNCSYIHIVHDKTLDLVHMDSLSFIGYCCALQACVLNASPSD